MQKWLKLTAPHTTEHVAFSLTDALLTSLETKDSNWGIKAECWSDSHSVVYGAVSLLAKLVLTLQQAPLHCPNIVNIKLMDDNIFIKKDDTLEVNLLGFILLHLIH